MSRNWLRSCSLAFSGGSGGKTISGGGPTDLRIRFQIISHTVQAPNMANFIITNPSPDTIARVQQEFNTVSFNAGYQDNTGLLFSGTITEPRYGEIEGRTDRLLQIWAVDSDIAYNQAMVSKTLAAGCTPLDEFTVCLEAMAPFGITLGGIIGVDLSQPIFPRGVPMAGMARDYMREVANNAGATFYIENGKVYVIGKNAAGPGGSIMINSQTGMIYQPIQTQYGIIVRCLIRPDIHVSSNIQINEQDVVSPQFKNTTLMGQSTIAEQTNLMYQLNPQGQYRVLRIETNGDTRGNEWDQELTCLGVGGHLNNPQIQSGFTPPEPVGLGLS